MSKEFNFDELDKAVNSLIGGQSTESPVGAATPSSTPVTPQAPPRDAAPVPPRSIPPPQRPTTPLSAAPKVDNSLQETPLASTPVSNTPGNAKPTVERPSVGRVMDVTHPGATTGQASNDAASKVKRGVGAEGKTVTPLSDNITPDPLPEDSAANTPNSTQLSVKAPIDPEAMKTTPDTEEKPWQDPLEAAKKDAQEKVLKADAADRLNTPSAEASPSGKDEKLEGEKPLFLPDAKVEKRPLGAFASKGSEEERSQGETKKEETENSEAQKTPKLTIDGVGDIDAKKEDESNEPLPPELGKEIVAVEAGGKIASGEDESKKDDETDDPKGIEDQSKKDAKPVTFSIPKQYKEKPTSGDSKPKSIYDTEEYHQSIISNAKKQQKGSKKILVWTLIIIGLLIVGVGVGAGAYFLIGI